MKALELLKKQLKENYENLNFTLGEK